MAGRFLLPQSLLLGNDVTRQEQHVGSLRNYLHPLKAAECSGVLLEQAVSDRFRPQAGDRILGDHGRTECDSGLE